MRALAFIKYITFRRLTNELCSRLNYLLSCFGWVRYTHMPTFIAIEPANYCMLHCPQCPVGMRATQPEEHALIPEAIWMRVLNEAAPFAHTVIFHFQGEPLLHPDLPKMIRYAHQLKFFTMLSTNAQLLTPAVAEALVDSGLDRIIVSIDGLTEPTYSHYRVGGSLAHALAGMRALADCKQQKGYGPEIEMQCLYLKSNQHEWPLFREKYRQLGADKISMKTAQFYDFEQGNPDMPDDSRYSRYKRNTDGSYRLKKKLHNRCYRLWSGCVITTDGTVLPCCFDKDHRFPLGCLASSSLEDIMHGGAAQWFRQRLIRHRASISMCTNCI